MFVAVQHISFDVHVGIAVYGFLIAAKLVLSGFSSLYAY